MIITGKSDVVITLLYKLLRRPFIMQVMSRSTLVIWPRHTTVLSRTTPPQQLPPTPSSVPPSSPLSHPPPPARYYSCRYPTPVFNHPPPSVSPVLHGKLPSDRALLDLIPEIPRWGGYWAGSFGRQRVVPSRTLMSGWISSTCL
jgi:hypothetical protein